MVFAEVHSKACSRDTESQNPFLIKHKVNTRHHQRHKRDGPDPRIVSNRKPDDHIRWKSKGDGSRNGKVGPDPEREKEDIVANEGNKYIIDRVRQIQGQYSFHPRYHTVAPLQIDQVGRHAAEHRACPKSFLSRGVAVIAKHFTWTKMLLDVLLV